MLKQWVKSKDLVRRINHPAPKYALHFSAHPQVAGGRFKLLGQPQLGQRQFNFSRRWHAAELGFGGAACFGVCGPGCALDVPAQMFAE
jgi:hypothetical protein